MHPDANVFNDLVAKIQETNKFAFVRWGEYDGTFPAAGASVLIVRANFTYDEPHSSADEDERRSRSRARRSYGAGSMAGRRGIRRRGCRSSAMNARSRIGSRRRMV
jgi:hypothetical protein